MPVSRRPGMVHHPSPPTFERQCLLREAENAEKGAPKSPEPLFPIIEKKAIVNLPEIIFRMFLLPGGLYESIRRK